MGTGGQPEPGRHDTNLGGVVGVQDEGVGAEQRADHPGRVGPAVGANPAPYGRECDADEDRARSGQGGERGVRGEGERHGSGNPRLERLRAAAREREGWGWRRGLAVGEFGLDAGQLERVGVAEESEQTGVLSFLFP